METNPFDYSPTVYLWVIGLSSVAGLVQFINSCIQNKNDMLYVIALNTIKGRV